MSATKVPTRAQRQKHVRQMNANHAIEGFAPDATDKQLQQQYIDGTASLEDMLAHAREFAGQAQGK
jgi:hypothetical protein